MGLPMDVPQLASLFHMTSFPENTRPVQDKKFQSLVENILALLQIQSLTFAG